MKAQVAKDKVSYAAAQTPDAENREVDDFYPTWPAATRALLTRETFVGRIWEPACGEGDMSKELLAAGYDVTSTDLIDRGYGEGGRDFLMEWQPRAENIVTNPPFREAEAFIERALMLTDPSHWRPDDWQAAQARACPCRGADDYCGCQNTYQHPPHKVVMYLRLAFLEGIGRGLWFPKTPLARVYVLSRRVPTQRGRIATEEDSGGPIAFAWFVWEHGWQGDPLIRFLDWKGC